MLYLMHLISALSLGHLKPEGTIFASVIPGLGRGKPGATGACALPTVSGALLGSSSLGQTWDTECEGAYRGL